MGEMLDAVRIGARTIRLANSPTRCRMRACRVTTAGDDGAVVDAAAAAASSTAVVDVVLPLSLLLLLLLRSGGRDAVSKRWFRCWCRSVVGGRVEIVNALTKEGAHNRERSTRVLWRHSRSELC